MGDERRVGSYPRVIGDLNKTLKLLCQQQLLKDTHETASQKRALLNIQHSRDCERLLNGLLVPGTKSRVVSKRP